MKSKKIKHLKPSIDEEEHAKFPNLADKSAHVERFKQTLQWLLDDRKISEAELSRMTNLSPATIHRLVYGITDPRLTTLRAIASFFEIKIEQLMGDYPIPSVTQLNNESSDKVLFSSPILIPYIDWNDLPQHIQHMNDMTVSNWAKWHATALDVPQEDISSDYFATKLIYTAGNLLQAESIVVVKSIADRGNLKIGDCILGCNEKTMLFIGQISGSGNTVMTKGGDFIQLNQTTIYGVIIKCELPFYKISRYTNVV